MRADVRALVRQVEERGWGGIPEVSTRDDAEELRRYVSEVADTRGWRMRTQWRAETAIFTAARIDVPRDRAR